MNTEKRLKIAREMFRLYIEAEKAILTGQEYSIGSQKLRRADLPSVAKQRKYWHDEVMMLEGRNKNRVQRVVLRDK